MRLINVHTLQFEDYFATPAWQRPLYMILSHRWGSSEISYKDWLKGRNRYMAGYAKVMKFCEIVRNLNLSWQVLRSTSDGRGIPTVSQISHVWVDTVCIDKTSSSELSEAINSMYAWYSNASICFVHLQDFSVGPTDALQFNLLKCDWFSRGWTLQELLAPSHLCFCDSSWTLFGRVDPGYRYSSDLYWNRFMESMSPPPSDLISIISTITKIPVGNLRMPGRLQERLAHLQPCIAQTLSWAAERKTTRPEDRAYCLLGLLGVNMPLLYGEGDKAFRRLQEEVVKSSADKTIFAWDSSGPPSPYLLSPEIEYFRNSGAVVRTAVQTKTPYAVTNIGMRMEEPLFLVDIDFLPPGIMVRSALPPTKLSSHVRDTYNDNVKLLRLDCVTKVPLSLAAFALTVSYDFKRYIVATAEADLFPNTNEEHDYVVYLVLQEQEPESEAIEDSLAIELQQRSNIPRLYCRLCLMCIQSSIERQIGLQAYHHQSPYYVAAF